MDDDFFDFMVLWDLMFGDEDEDEDEGFNCPLCGAFAEKGRELFPVRGEKNAFFCPECDEALFFDPAGKKVVPYREKPVPEEPHVLRELPEVLKGKKIIKLICECPRCGKKTTAYDASIKKAKCTTCDWVNHIDPPATLEEYYDAYYMLIEPGELEA